MNIGSKFNVNMIQAQNHKSWSKVHLKLQKEPKISMMVARQFFSEF
jgi:hypothetical protein